MDRLNTQLETFFSFLFSNDTDLGVEGDGINQEKSYRQQLKYIWINSYVHSFRAIENR